MNNTRCVLNTINDALIFLTANFTDALVTRLSCIAKLAARVAHRGAVEPEPLT